jgi:hypothetical protein
MATIFFIEDINKTYNLLESTSYKRALQRRPEKGVTISEELNHLDAMLMDDWKGPYLKLRHTYT